MSSNGASPNPHRTPEIAAHHQAAYFDWLSKKQTESLSQRAEARRVRAERNVPLVVVVDDEVVVAITLSEVLRRHGYNAVWFSDSLDALAYVERGPVDLLLSDSTVPQLDGIELATTVHAFQPGCILILFSALADYPNVADRIAHSGLQAHLESKPLQIRQLVSTLALLLEHVQAPTAYIYTEERLPA